MSKGKKSINCPYCQAINLAKANTCRVCGQVLPKKKKYGNKKTMADGFMFDSAREAKRYRELKLLEKAGKITELQLQVEFVLAPGVKYADKRPTPPIRYIADFVYFEVVDAPKEIAPTGKVYRHTVEDAKGMRTPVYRIKKHLMLAVHKIEVKEV